MLSLTIQDVLSRTYRNYLRFRLYRIFDGAVVLYVGQSSNPFRRVWDHLGEGSHNDLRPSPFGTLIMLLSPPPLEWRVEFYTLADCLPFVMRHAQAFYRNYYQKHLELLDDEQGCMEIAEVALIEEFRPCLNIQKNAGFGQKSELLRAVCTGHLLGFKQGLATIVVLHMKRSWQGRRQPCRMATELLDNRAL